MVWVLHSLAENPFCFYLDCLVSASAAAAIIAGFGFIDLECPTFHFIAVQCGDRRLRLFIAAHLNKTETPTPSRLTIHDHFGTFNRAVLAENLLQGSVINIEAKISNIEVLTHYVLLLCMSVLELLYPGHCRRGRAFRPKKVGTVG
jgi:hypothetical protein